MDFDLFLSSPRWEILQIIAKRPSSPVEIAQELKTTVSYVSQQLKLLDAGGLVTKKKTGSVEKGKPRTLFYLSDELLYLTTLTRDFSEKKLIHLTDYHKTIIKIWLLDDSSLHYYIEKFFWELEDSLQDIEAIFIDAGPKLIIVSEDKRLKSRIGSFAEKLKRKIEYSFISKNQLKKISPDFLISLHDPKNILDELKGGKKE